jgi:hypothetical protein
MALAVAHAASLGVDTLGQPACAVRVSRGGCSRTLRRQCLTRATLRRQCLTRAAVAPSTPTVTGGASGAASVVRFPRSRLATPFAVLLLRSSYETTDELDFVPMDKFQSIWWNRRAAEQERYTALIAPLRATQGDVSDPLYFDFLCFVQLLVVGELMKRGEQVFTELIGAEGEARVVRRSPELGDNALLPDAYGRLVGDKIFTRLRDGFEEFSSFGGPTACVTPSDFDCLAEGVKAICACFESNGFAFSLRLVAADAAAKQLRVHVEGGATLFAMAELANRRAAPLPAFLEYTLLAFTRASGVPAAAASTRLSRTGFDVELRLS